MEEQAKLWSRETPWRQGYILTSNAVEELQISSVDGAVTCVVVISHDCDLANDDLDAEPNVEVIVGRFIQKIDGNFSWGKSPRKLHLELDSADAKQSVELLATSKNVIAKNVLARYEPDFQYQLSGQMLATLQSWLAVRYNRASFPDEFNNRLKSAKIDKSFAKLITPLESYLSAVFFIVDKGKMIDRADGSDYSLDIMLVYPAGGDPEDAFDKVDSLSEKVSELFSRLPNIVLKSCFPICEDDLTVSKAKLASEWKLEYLSLKSMVE